ncbi:hypothetical protein AAF712_007081 [Marasmius tenuissimus]|uniref:SET domain-containing protein n=1 Tax=Marasmius tenuissimus TaxID=585030 RepID=A0ABR2ZXZ3_9AGAR
MKRKRDSSTRSPLSNLLEFCSDFQIQIDSRLHIDYDNAQGKSIGVFLSAKGNEDEDNIPPGTTGISSFHCLALERSRLLYLIPRKVVRIPKKSVLSVKSSSLTKYFGNGYEFAPYGLEAQLELALAVYLEDSKGSASPWHLYLKSLPEKAVDLPMFWATEVIEEEGRNEDVKMALGWMMGSGVYRHLIPLNTRPRKPSLHAYYRAFSLVSSRAFIVDAYHGLAMVPVADAFNHIRDNHVHLETEFDAAAATHPRPKTEIFNTYGANLSNAQLLNQYGFILDANEADFVEFDDDDVLSAVGIAEQSPLVVIRKNWAEQAKSVHLSTLGTELEDSELIYASENAMHLRLSSDGRVSLGMVVLVYVGLEHRGDCLQGWIDALMHLEDEGEGLVKLANTVISLCEGRLNGITQVDVGAMLDDLPASHWRTRAVGMHIMAERSILRSCISSWEEYLQLEH